MFFIVGEINISGEFAPVLNFIGPDAGGLFNAPPMFGVFNAEPFYPIERIFQIPTGNVGGIPIVVHIVFVFIGSGYTQQDIFLFGL